jgi:hypothetical protein
MSLGKKYIREISTKCEVIMSYLLEENIEEERKKEQIIVRKESKEVDSKFSTEEDLKNQIVEILNKTSQNNVELVFDTSQFQIDPKDESLMSIYFQELGFFEHNINPKLYDELGNHGLIKTQQQLLLLNGIIFRTNVFKLVFEIPGIIKKKKKEEERDEKALRPEKKKLTLEEVEKRISKNIKESERMKELQRIEKEERDKELKEEATKTAKYRRGTEEEELVINVLRELEKQRKRAKMPLIELYGVLMEDKEFNIYSAYRMLRESLLECDFNAEEVQLLDALIVDVLNKKNGNKSHVIESLRIGYEL